jgi:hypothetical protein
MVRLFKRCEYLLKGRGPDGTWEELESFPKRPGREELYDYVNQYREEGYNAFALYEVCEDRTRKVWMRTYGKPKKGLGDSLDEIVQFKEKLDKLKELFGGNVDPYAVLASSLSIMISMREFCSKFPEICGVPQSSASPGSAIQEYVNVIRSIVDLFGSGKLEQADKAVRELLGRYLGGGGAKVPAEAFIRDEAVEEVNKIAQEAVKRATEIVKTECEVLHACKEGGGSGGAREHSEAEAEEPE